jgi:capsular polysaccharide biosynthesis protein
MQLQAQLPSTNVRPLDEAQPPSEPASPEIGLRLLLGAVLGGMLAVSYALGLEWLKPRVRTPLGVRAATGAQFVHGIDFDRSAAASILRKAA